MAVSQGVSAILAWTLVSEAPIPDDLGEILAPGETPVAAFRTIRDTATFTDKRLIIRDAQGLSGKKIEIYSLPYSSIHMWSSENAPGFFDGDEELELWTKLGHIKVRIKKGLNIRRIDQLISAGVLSS